jgi:hypothetical protein
MAEKSSENDPQSDVEQVLMVAAEIDKDQYLMEDSLPGHSALVHSLCSWVPGV